MKEIYIGESIWLKYRTEKYTTFLRLERKGQNLYRLYSEDPESHSGSAQDIVQIIVKSPFLRKTVPVKMGEDSEKEEEE